jgi:hypothetical protein
MTILTQKPLFKLHIEHKEWLNKLAFYEDEIRLMQSRIADIASKNINIDAMIQVEHYRNHLAVQKEYIEILRHNINEQEAYLQKKMIQNPAVADQRSTSEQPYHKSEIESFEKNYNALRKDLIDFLCKIF